MNINLKKANNGLFRYYEIWFYYYGETDKRTDFNKEFTFYIKIDKEIASNEDMLEVLKNRMNEGTENEQKTYKYWLEGHLDNMSSWFEIDAQEFTDGCGLPA